MFNSYEYGGYLIWKLWPAQRVFIDGRALSESRVYGLCADSLQPRRHRRQERGRTAGCVRCGGHRDKRIRVRVGKNLYTLAPALADPRQTKWKLVYHDPEAMVLMRQPPSGIAALPSLQILDHLEAECGLHIDREPQLPRCARGLAQTFAKVGDSGERESGWGRICLSRTRPIRKRMRLIRSSSQRGILAGRRLSASLNPGSAISFSMSAISMGTKAERFS